MFRQFKKKVKLIWFILADSYTYSPKYNCWWMWDGYTTVLFNEEDRTLVERGHKPKDGS